MKNKFLLIAASTLLFSCGQPLVSDKIPDTPTSGEVKVFCEEGFASIMKRQTVTFEELYTNAKVHVNFVNEKQAIEGLYNDCCKVIVISRVLSADEEKKFNTANLFPRQICIAKNAIAFLSNISSADTTISAEKIKALLSGADSSYNLVFDNDNSGVTKYLKDSLLKGKPFGKNCFATKNTQELVKLLGERKNTIGVIDYSWISDMDETSTKEILTKVRPLAVSSHEKENGFYPDQSNIETKEYPFCRYTYIMRRSADFTLGAGFMAFVAGPKGQLIMLKAGLVPAFRQERQVEINTAPLGNQ
ncbi:MAG: PstS family phosphate ABC transporter substrate-binding protein [Bacteroidia bacterium]